MQKRRLILSSRSRARVMAVVTVIAMLLAFGAAARSTQAAAAPGSTVGQPTVGMKPIQETTAAIMERQKALDLIGARQAPAPHNETEADVLRNPNPNAPLVSSVGSRAPEFANIPISPNVPFSAGLNFTGATSLDGSGTPPDTMGAAGPTQYIVAINGRIRSFNKFTGVADGVINTTMDVFFNSVRGGVSTSDPVIRYDRLTQRWFVTMINTTAQNNRILLASSDSATISGTTVWSQYFFTHSSVAPVGDTDCLFDYPTTGIDAYALYIGGNNFCPASFRSTNVFVVRKSSMLSGGPIVVSVFRNMGTLTNGGEFTPRGVDSWDPNTGEGYTVGTDLFTYGVMILRRFSDPGGVPVMSPPIRITVPNNVEAFPVDHKGNNYPGGTYNGLLDSERSQKPMMAVMRNGRLWVSQSTAVNNVGVSLAAGNDRVAVRWYEFGNLSTAPSAVQIGTIYDPNAQPFNYTYSGIMVNGQGHTAFGMTQVNVGIYASAAYTGRLVTDPPGFTHRPKIYKDGQGAYNAFDIGTSRPQRWGDYSQTSLDPCDDMTFWNIQEFTAAGNTPFSSNAQWGVQVLQMKAPPPAPVYSASPASIAAGQASVDVVITGAYDRGAGYYDTPASMASEPCRTRLTASMTAGVLVNSVQYLTPTTIRLNISTAGAANGAKPVLTITNPDGQSVTSTVITVDSPTNTPFSATNTATVTQVPSATQTVQQTATVTYTPSVPPPASVGIVTNLNDSGAGSLRDVIAALGPNSVVQFQNGLTGTITLTSGQLIIDKSLTINGPGARVVSVSGNNASRVFNVPVNNLTVRISGLTVTQGFVSNSERGGGISCGGTGTTLTLTEMAFVGNNVAVGVNSVGAAINNAGCAISLIRSLVANNFGDTRGAIQNQGATATLTIINSTIANNTNTNAAGNSSAGIRQLGSTLTIINSTFANNGTVTNAANGVNVGSGGANIRNSIFYGNTGFDVGGALTSFDYNVIGTTAAGTTIGGTTTNNTNANPLLGALANNGGPTDTLLPGTGSSAIDKIPAAGGCNGANILDDQRIFGRPFNVTCDIGAVEVGASAIVATNTPTVTSTFLPSATATSSATATATRTNTPLPPRADTIGTYTNGVFYLRNSNSAGAADIAVSFGNAGWFPVTGDWNGDGADTVGAFDPTTGVFYLRDSNTSGGADYLFAFGNPNDTPFAGRWTADMTHDGVGVYRNSNGILYQSKTLAFGFSDFFAVFGNPGDVGIAGDFDGNGFDSIGIYRSAGTNWFLSNNSTPAGITFSDISFSWDITATGIPVIGDWNGDGTSTVGYFNDSTAGFVLHSTNAAIGTDTVFPYGSVGSKPVAGKWTLPSGANPFVVIQPSGLAGFTNGGEGGAE